MKIIEPLCEVIGEREVSIRYGSLERHEKSVNFIKGLFTGIQQSHLNGVDYCTVSRPTECIKVVIAVMVTEPGKIVALGLLKCPG